MAKYTICLDIGGTKILGAIFDDLGQIVFRLKKKTKAAAGMANIEATIASLIDELLKGYNITTDSLRAISAGAPGVIDEQRGVILFAPNLPWQNYPIRQAMEKRFKTPFFIGNDVNLGVLGEWKYGAARGLEHVIGLFVGTGLGGGMILNGQLYTGYGFKGAELGHMIVEPEGPLCNCGQRGCLEAISSKLGMTDYIRVQVNRGRDCCLKDSITSTVFKSKALRSAYQEKDIVATEAIDRACHYLAIASGSLVNIFSPQMVVFGGGVIEAMGEVFLDKVLKEVDKYSWPSIRSTVTFAKAALGDDSILYGALTLCEKA